MMKLFEKLKEKIGWLLLIVFLIVCYAFLDAGYGLEVGIVLIAATVIGLIYNWRMLAAAYNFGRDKGHEIKRGGEVRKEIREVLKNGKV